MCLRAANKGLIWINRIQLTDRQSLRDHRLRGAITGLRVKRVLWPYFSYVLFVWARVKGILGTVRGEERLF